VEREEGQERGWFNKNRGFKNLQKKKGWGREEETKTRRGVVCICEQVFAT
jgi:hypothetical protein